MSMNTARYFSVSAALKCVWIFDHWMFMFFEFVQGQEKPFELTLKKIEEAYEKGVKLGHRIRGLILINPHNPLGTLHDRQLLVEIMDFCSK